MGTKPLWFAASLHGRVAEVDLTTQKSISRRLLKNHLPIQPAAGGELTDARFVPYPARRHLGLHRVWGAHTWGSDRGDGAQAAYALSASCLTRIFWKEIAP